MKPESLGHKPLANLLRGLSEGHAQPAGEELTTELSKRGLDVDKTVSQIEGRISAFLQRQPAVRSQDLSRDWKHPSVRRFAAGDNPIEKMVSVVTDFALETMQGLRDLGKTIDPFFLAEMKGIRVVPNEAISDARLVPIGNKKVQIEFNPNRPKTRIRFSIAHELAHTFFPDCYEQVRNRLSRAQFGQHDWELEMICNIGAAELLMPMATFPELRGESLNIDTLRELRNTLEVSSEALLSRVARVTTEPCSMFAASRIESGNFCGRYRLDYVIGSRAWQPTTALNTVLPKETVLPECSAIGFTAKNNEVWPGAGSIHVECIGVLPYRGSSYPRVIGIIRPLTPVAPVGLQPVYVTGDVTQPRGSGSRIIAFIINDKALSWGKGASRAVASKWPHTQKEFQQWIHKERSAMRLGNTFNVTIAENLWAFALITQHGYGPSPTPRIRYGALKSCLDGLVTFARERNATVHIPRLGSGEGGAPWAIVSQIVDETLCRAGVPVTIYDLPNAKPEQSPELPGLFSVPGKS